MAFLYPWGNTQQLNLDWIIQKIKELENAPPSSAEVTAIANALLAATYSVGSAYNVGDIVYRNQKLYVCNTAITSPGETWDLSHWDEVLLGDAVAELIQAIGGGIVQDVRYNNHKIQQKKNGSYADVIPVEDTPSNNSDRLASSKAIYNIKALLSQIDIANVTNISTADIDLDNFFDGGVFYFSSTYTPINKPQNAGDYGFLFNITTSSTSRIVQVWIDHQKIGNAVYFRNNNTAVVSFSAWKKVATDIDIATYHTAKNISTFLTIPATPPVGISDIHVSAVQAGNIVIVSIGLTRDGTAISNFTNGQIATGLPIPAVVPTGASNVVIPFGEISPATDSNIRPLICTVSSSGELRVRYGNIASTFNGSFTYLTNDFTKL